MGGFVIEHFDRCYFVAAALYAGYLLAELAEWPRAPWVLGAGLLAQTIGLLLRAVAIGYFPLSNKFESFYGFSLAMMAVVLLIQSSPSRRHRLSAFALGAGFYVLTFWFERLGSFPPPLMRTIWYPLHVPASFVSYALWGSSAAAAVAVLSGQKKAALRRTIDRHALWGWCLFSVSMVFGGAWGFVAWGAYFLWDPKVVWSVLLWLFYSGFIHLRYWPRANRPRIKAAMALVGLACVLVAYVGTSLLFGHGSHSFG